MKLQKLAPTVEINRRISKHIFLVLLLFFPTHLAVAMQSDLPKLTERFGASSQQADFVIVLDTSDSMQKFWDIIKLSVADFVGAIPEGDYVSILYFDADAGELITPRSLTTDNKAAIRQQILGLGTPVGRQTDLGAGINRALDELNRPNANRLQFVFFFTDFEHAPLSSSKWSVRSCSNSAWVELQEKKRRLVDAQNHIAKAYALKLPLGGNVGRDLPLFKCVFAKVEETPIADSVALREWFDRRKAEVERDKLRIQVEQEIDRGVRIEAAAQTPGKEVPFKIISQCEHLDVDINGIRVESVQPGRFSSLPMSVQAFTLEPGKNRSLTLPLRYLGTTSYLQIQHCNEYDFGADLVVECVFQPRDEIEKLLDPTMTKLQATNTYSQTVNTSVRTCNGWSPWILIVILLTMVAIGYVIWRAWGPAYITCLAFLTFGLAALIGHHELTAAGPVYAILAVLDLSALKGLFRRHAFTEIQVRGRETKKFKLPSKVKELLVGNTNECKVRPHIFIADLPGAVELHFIAQRPRLFRLTPKRGVYVIRRKGTAKMKGWGFNPKTRKQEKVERTIPTDLKLNAMPIDITTEILVGDGELQYTIKLY